VSFKTTRTDFWKNSIIDYFGITNTNVQSQKTGYVIKVTLDLNNERNNSVKVNLFHSGAVVIQGAKCSKFTDNFFHLLKHKCDVLDRDSLDETVTEETSLDDTVTEETCLKTPFVPQLVKSKSMEDVHEPHSPHTPTKTPTIAQMVGPNNQKLSPQQRASQHCKYIDQKFEYTFHLEPWTCL
jgi:hypothetical protein